MRKKRSASEDSGGSRLLVSAERTTVAALQPSSETVNVEGVLAWQPRHLLLHLELFEADYATVLPEISSRLILHNHQLPRRIRRPRQASENPAATTDEFVVNRLRIVPEIILVPDDGFVVIRLRNTPDKPAHADNSHEIRDVPEVVEVYVDGQLVNKCVMADESALLGPWVDVRSLLSAELEAEVGRALATRC